jgi:hypothetical protein
MALSAAKQDVWAASLVDKPGSLAGKLTALADAGADLEFVIARRTDTKKKAGVVFVTPIKGRKQIAAAKKVGFKKTTSLHSVKVEGPDKPGIGARITTALADAGINLRGLSAAAIGRKMVCHIAFDKAADATKAIRILRKL